jgi:peroxiredoxin
VRKVLQQKGGDIVAVSVDPPERLAEGRREHPDLPCLLVSDAKGDALHALGLIHPLARGRFVAAPANILIARGGKVLWTHYAGIVMDRPDPRAVLEQVTKLA